MRVLFKVVFIFLADLDTFRVGLFYVSKRVLSTHARTHTHKQTSSQHSSHAHVNVFLNKHFREHQLRGHARHDRRLRDCLTSKVSSNQDGV